MNTSLDRIREEACEFAGIGLYRFTFDGNILFADRGALRIFDLNDWFPNPESIAGRNIAELVVYKSPKGAMRQEIREQGALHRRDWNFRTLKGNEKWVVEDAYLIRDSGSGEESIQVIVRDITDRKKVENALRLSERRFRETLEHVNLIIVQLDVHSQILFCNDYLLRLTGWERHAILGKNWFETFVPEDWQEATRRVFLNLENAVSDIPSHYENPIITRGGALRHILWTNTALRDPHGKMLITAIGRDITDRLLAEEAVRQSEALYRITLDSMADAIHLSDAGQTILLANSTLIRMNEKFGLATEVIGRNIFDVYPFLPGSVLEEYQQVFSTGKEVVTEESFVLEENEVITETHKTPVLEKGTVTRVLTVIRNITESRKAALALHESEEKYRTILNGIQEGYYEVDLKGNFTFFNPALCRIFGYSEEELRGMNFRLYYADEATIKKVAQTYMSVYQSEADVQMTDWEIVRKNGERAILEVSISVIRDREGKKIGFRGIVRDVTHRKQAEKALREAEHRYEELFENANDIVYTHDLNGNFTSLNKAGERISGYSREEALCLNALDIVPPEYREFTRQMIVQKLHGEDITRYEVAIIAKDGRIIPVEVSTRVILKDGKPAGIQGIARDITERKQAEKERSRLEAQMRHTQKLESLGVLAGGIAHDFNNLLVGIMGNAGLALTRLPEGSPARDYVSRIEATSRKAAELTNQMLAYTGRGPFLVRPIDLSKLTQEMGHLLSASISKKVILRFECPQDLPLIQGDAAQLHQVVMNLITNASDAIGDNHGVVTVRTGAFHADCAYLSRTYLAEDLSEGLYVSLEVVDTGCGMDAETIGRMFDPFFSTKFTGRGLGLAAVLGIVRAHRGAISVYSEPGHGTTFKVLLPAIENSGAAPEKEWPVSTVTETSAWKSTGTILLADDEESVREVAKEILQEAGFTVLTAENGQIAVDLFQQHEDIRAVILDLTMPVLSGKETFHTMRAMRPQIPILLSSGYTEQDITIQFSGSAPDGFLQKPFGPDDLMRALRNAFRE
ncbi:MAG TPA: PAS domain S-box protein [Candidatus Hydrogenedentes bacterium]|nr:PAS domain S-box protein [Candidatus Hydrogenedentota bacterium]